MIDFLFLLFNVADRISITGPSISGTSLPLPILVAATETWRRRVASLSTPFWIPHKGLLISAGAMVLRMTLQAGSLCLMWGCGSGSFLRGSESREVALCDSPVFA